MNIIRTDDEVTQMQLLVGLDTCDDFQDVHVNGEQEGPGGF